MQQLLSIIYKKRQNKTESIRSK